MMVVVVCVCVGKVTQDLSFMTETARDMCNGLDLALGQKYVCEVGVRLEQN